MFAPWLSWLQRPTVIYGIGRSWVRASLGQVYFPGKFYFTSARYWMLLTSTLLFWRSSLHCNRRSQFMVNVLHLRIIRLHRCTDPVHLTMWLLRICADRIQTGGHVFFINSVDVLYHWDTNWRTSDWTDPMSGLLSQVLRAIGGNGIPNTRVTRCWAEKRLIDEEALQNFVVRASTKYDLGYDSTSSRLEVRGDNCNFSLKTNTRENILLMNKQGFSHWMMWIVQSEYKSEEIYLRTWHMAIASADSNSSGLPRPHLPYSQKVLIWLTIQLLPTKADNW